MPPDSFSNGDRPKPRRQCPRCGGLVPVDEGFCPACAAHLGFGRETEPIAVECPACESSTFPTQPFCQECSAVIEEGFLCPLCHMTVAVGSRRCPWCDRSFVVRWRDSAPRLPCPSCGGPTRCGSPPLRLHQLLILTVVVAVTMAGVLWMGRRIDGTVAFPFVEGLTGAAPGVLLLLYLFVEWWTRRADFCRDCGWEGPLTPAAPHEAPLLRRSSLPMRAGVGLIVLGLTMGLVALLTTT